MKRLKLWYYIIMNKNDLVSVIIPVFNRPVLVQQALNSVLKQTYSNFEIIAADDGSTDDTVEVLSQYAQIENIQILQMEHSGFAGKVRNKAVEKANGRWIAFLDSDDLWLPHKLMEQIQYLDDNEKYRFIHTLEKWDRNGKEISQAHRKHKKEGDLFKTSLGKCEIGPSTVMIDRELFLKSGGFREDLEICEDYELWLRLTSQHSIAYIDKPLVIKKAGHRDQLSEKYSYIEIFKIDALKALVEKNYFPREQLFLARKELSRKCRIYSKGCRKRGKEKEADKYESLYFFYSIDDAHREG